MNPFRKKEQLIFWERDQCRNEKKPNCNYSIRGVTIESESWNLCLLCFFVSQQQGRTQRPLSIEPPPDGAPGSSPFLHPSLPKERERESTISAREREREGERERMKQLNQVSNRAVWKRCERHTTLLWTQWSGKQCVEKKNWNLRPTRRERALSKPVLSDSMAWRCWSRSDRTVGVLSL